MASIPSHFHGALYTITPWQGQSQRQKQEQEPVADSETWGSASARKAAGQSKGDSKCLKDHGTWLLGL